MKTRSLSRGYLNYVYDYYTDLGINEISLVFEGLVTHQVLKALTGLLEEQLENENEDDLVQRRLYNVMVESLQNINRHAEAMHEYDHPHPGRGILLVDRKAEAYNVTTGNLINNYQIDELSEFLAKVNNMDHEALDDMYKNQIREGQLSAKGGAGLGFIDIRRKTGHPLDYHFVPVDNRTSFFIITAKISR